jgi:hypothetical protein
MEFSATMNTTTDDGNGKTVNFERPGTYTRATTKATKVEWYSKTQRIFFQKKKQKAKKKGKDWVGGSLFFFFQFSHVAPNVAISHKKI